MTFSLNSTFNSLQHHGARTGSCSQRWLTPPAFAITRQVQMFGQQMGDSVRIAAIRDGASERSAMPSRQSVWGGSMTLPSELIRPPSRAEVIFWKAERQQGIAGHGGRGALRSCGRGRCPRAMRGRAGVSWSSPRRSALSKPATGWKKTRIGRSSGQSAWARQGGRARQTAPGELGGKRPQIEVTQLV